MNGGSPAIARAGIWRTIAALGFAYILARPVSNAQILTPVLGLLGAIAVVTILSGRARLARELNLAVLATFAFGITWLWIGSANPGFSNALLVFVEAPLLYWVCSIAVDERMLRLVFRAAAWVTVGLGLVIVLYVAGSTGVIPQVLPQSFLDQFGAGIGDLSGGATQIRFYSLSTLVATGPMWCASLLVGADGVLPGYRLRVAAAVAAVAGSMVGGRRAIALVLVLVPVVVWIVKKLVAARRHGAARVDSRVLIGAIVAAAVAVAAFPSLITGSLVADAWRGVAGFVSGGGTGTADQFTRTYEAQKLLDGWSASPLWGHGLGWVIPGYQRSQAQPWQFELQYHALLMQAGVLGALVIAAGAVVTINAVVKAARRRPELLPSLIVACTTAAAMLIANATNPYLQAMGHQWAIFLPVAVVNLMLVSKPRAAEETSSPRRAAVTARR